MALTIMRTTAHFVVVLMPADEYERKLPEGAVALVDVAIDLEVTASLGNEGIKVAATPEPTELGAAIAAAVQRVHRPDRDGDGPPHSRLCGPNAHRHGRGCASDCPTCGGLAAYTTTAPGGSRPNE